MKENTLKLIVKLATVFAVTLIMVMLGLLTFQYISINKLSDDEAMLNAQLQELVEQRQSFESEYSYMYNNQTEFVEEYVRQVLGWGREGDIKFTTSS